MRARPTFPNCSTPAPAPWTQRRFGARSARRSGVCSARNTSAEARAASRSRATERRPGRRLGMRLAGRDREPIAALVDRQDDGHDAGQGGEALEVVGRRRAAGSPDRRGSDRWPCMADVSSGDASGAPRSLARSFAAFNPPRRGSRADFVGLDPIDRWHSCWKNRQRCTVAGRRKRPATRGRGSGRAVRGRHARCNGLASERCEVRCASNRRRQRTGGSHGKGVCVVRCDPACPGRHIGADESCAVPGLSRGSQDGAVLEWSSNGRTRAANPVEPGRAWCGADRSPAPPRSTPSACLSP